MLVELFTIYFWFEHATEQSLVIIKTNKPWLNGIRSIVVNV